MPSLPRPALLCVVVAVLGCGPDLMPEPGTRRLGVTVDPCTVTLTAGGDVEAFLNGLQPGDVACIQGAVQADIIDVFAAGSAVAPIRVTSAPGQLGTIRGRIGLHAPTAHFIFSNLLLDGRSSEPLFRSPEINGSNMLFEFNEVTNYDENASCFGLGSAGFGYATSITVRRNRIHDCGDIRGAVDIEGQSSARIEENFLYGADRWGVQLNPNGDGNDIRRNVIDGAELAIILAGDAASTSDQNTIRENTFSNSRNYHLAYFWSTGGDGTGNTVVDNCLGSAGVATLEQPARGYSESGNLVATPVFVDAPGGDFHSVPGSPCQGRGPQGWVGPDVTPPVAGTVFDGLAADFDVQLTTDRIHASWSSFSEAESAMTLEWAIGTAPLADDVQPFTPVTGSSATRTGLSLTTGQSYYVSVRATNEPGLASVVSSDGVLVDPEGTRRLRVACGCSGPAHGVGAPAWVLLWATGVRLRRRSAGGRSASQAQR